MRERSGNGSFDPIEGRLRARTRAIALSIIAASTLVLSIAGTASADRPFAPRFSQNVQGAITFAANTILTCPNSNADCAAARAGTGSKLNNNQFNMTYVDVDDDPSTFNSSSATITIPTDAQVLFAGLYYGGRTSAGTGGTQAPNPNARGTVRLKTPGGTYQTLTAAVDSTSGSTYAAFVEVTSQVQATGAGSYTVANVQAGTGEDRGGGWSIVVAYRDPDEPARNLTIFDGLESVGQGETKTFGVSGFQTPASGPVQTELGFVTYEGDRGLTGDSATLNGTVLSSATNPPNNFFNSSISRNGTEVSDKDPNYNNQLGFDSNQVNGDGILANGATSAAIRLQTTRDVFLPQVVTFATEIFSPEISAAKSVQNITNPSQPARSGDVLRYTVAYGNSGGDGATGFTATDVIPGGTTYRPGSLAITAGPNSPATPTDAIGDDLAEFLSASNSVRFRLGQGATNTQGGLLTAASGVAPSTTITFEVTVDSGLRAGTEIANTAEADYLSETLGTPQSARSNTVVTEVIAPDLEMSKRHVVPIVGVDVEFTLGVENVGNAPTNGSPVTVIDSFDPAAFSSITITSSPGWNCSATSGLNLSCTRTDTVGAGSPYPDIEVTGTLGPSPPATFTNEAEVTGGGDVDTGNNVAVDFLPVPPTSSDLSIVKTVSPATVLPGGRVTYTLTVRNEGPSNATGVTVNDSWLFSGLIDVTATPSQGSCPTVSTSSVVCQLGNLATGDTATIEVSATVDFDNASGLLNTASVEGDQADPRPDNNESSAGFDVAAASDLRVVKTAGENPTAGEDFSYTIQVTNDGPSAANQVVVTDQIPELFLPSEVLGPGFASCSAAKAGGTLSCTWDGSLAVGATATITLVGTLAEESAGMAVINTASAYSSEADPTPGNNSSSVTITPLPFANLSVGKVASREVVQPGQAFEYSLVVSNAGPLDAEPVTLVDELPSGLDLLEWPDECSLTDRILTCELGTVAVGERKNLVLTARARASLAGSEVLNTVRVNAPQPDPVPESAVDEWVTRVGTDKVSPSLIQKVKKPRVRSGKNDRLEIVVRNRSSRAITNARVCQSLPRQLVVVSTRTANLASRSRSRICWTIAILEPGASKTYWTSVRAISRRPVTVPVRADLSGGNAADLTDSGKVRIIPSKGRTPLPPTG